MNNQQEKPGKRAQLVRQMQTPMVRAGTGVTRFTTVRRGTSDVYIPGPGVPGVQSDPHVDGGPELLSRRNLWNGSHSSTG